MNTFCNRYVLDGRKAVAEPDLFKWMAWMEAADLRVAQTELGESRVLTVFLGLDCNVESEKTPVLFETAILRVPGMQSLYKRGATWEEAEANHRDAVTLVAKRLAVVPSQPTRE